jgi:hypothetical protein
VVGGVVLHRPYSNAGANPTALANAKPDTNNICSRNKHASPADYTGPGHSTRAYDHSDGHRAGNLSGDRYTHVEARAHGRANSDNHPRSPDANHHAPAHPAAYISADTPGVADGHAYTDPHRDGVPNAHPHTFRGANWLVRGVPI